MTINVRNKNIPKLRFPGFAGEWKIGKLREVSNIYDGTHQTPKYVKKGVEFVSVENIGNIEGTHKFITKEAFEKDFKIRPQKDDILMTRITAGIIGATSIVKNNNPLGYYVSLALIRKKGDVDVYFLNQLISSYNFKHELHKRIIHVAFPKKINLGDIGNCKILIPKKEEQQKIAEILVLVNEWIENLREQKENLAKYKKGMTQKIFSQEIKFKNNDGSNFPQWMEKKLGEIADKKSSSIAANNLDSNNGEYKVYGATGFLKKIDFYKEEQAYISIVKDGAGVGRILFCEPKSSVLGTLDIIKPKDDVNLYFLYLVLSKISFIKYTTGVTIPHIYFKDYEKEKLNLPILQEQQKIIKFLTSIDNLIESKQQQIILAEQWKKGLMQWLFV